MKRTSLPIRRILLAVLVLVLAFSGCTVNNTQPPLKTEPGPQGEPGIGILSVVKTSTDGLIDYYTITYTDGSTTMFSIQNGADGIQGIQGIQGETGEAGHSPVITIQDGYWYIDGVNTNQAASGSVDMEAIRAMLQNMVDEATYPAHVNRQDLWENGGITAGGAYYKSAKTLRTKDFISDEVCLVYAEGDYMFYAYVYDENDVYLGAWDGAQISTTSAKKLYYINPKGFDPSYKLKLSLCRLDASSVALNEFDNIHFLSESEAKAFYPAPTLTFIDDDGNKNALENWESITDEIGIKITSALVTGVIGDETHTTWDEVQRLQNKGYEFVSHTHNHVNLTTTSEENLILQFEQSIAALREHGCESRFLVYPYNAINAERMKLVKRYFAAGIGFGSGTDNILPLYTYHIKRYSICESDVTVEKEYNGKLETVSEYRSLDTLKKYIDAARINGSWVIIMTHLRNDDKYYFDENARNMIIELCKYATSNGVEIQTFGEAFDKYENSMEIGTLYDASHYIVDCNGVTHYRGE